MSLPRRAVIAITSATAPLHEGNPTGLFITEALHPFQVFTAAGFEVDLVSEKGVYTADWLSLQEDFLSGDDKKQWEDKSGEFRRKLDNMPSVDKVDGREYAIFYAAAGHAALIDFPHAIGLQRIAADTYNSGGVVSAVCHGAALLPGVLDATTGKSVIAGKKITGFTTEAENDMKIMDAIRGWGEPLIDEWAEKTGANYVRPKGVWDDYNVTDGRIVTGTNPQSAKSTAKAALEVLKTL